MHMAEWRPETGTDEEEAEAYPGLFSRLCLREEAGRTADALRIGRAIANVTRGEHREMIATSNDWTMTWTSAVQAIYALLPYTDKKDRYTLTDVMGVSGHAFRINIHPADVNAAGPTMFDPGQLLEHGLHLLGRMGRFRTRS
ncbi:hypothetical protein ABU162_07430 [Paenibacillus thiaminolyticus]|uniref:hypothetical protein n=1 Tax=Paenibacillus thiaminolyticus TaxID=49283 RepID=UPI0035A628AF